MNSEGNAGTPSSPEVQPPDVREELEQELVTHQGEQRGAPPQGTQTKGHSHLGAVDDEPTPIMPPMAGPADLLGERNADGQGNENGDTEIGEELWDPRDELTPG